MGLDISRLINPSSKSHYNIIYNHEDIGEETLTSFTFPHLHFWRVEDGLDLTS